LLLVFFLFNLVNAVAFAAIDADTFFGCAIPGIGIGEIAIPEWPGTALVWSDGVNFAYFVAVDGLKKDAVVGRAVLDNGGAGADTHQIFLSEFTNTDFEVIGNKADFLPCNPDIPFFGAGAALSALAALEMQAADVPERFFVHFRFHKFS
jgi:hypothetical protein